MRSNDSSDPDDFAGRKGVCGWVVAGELFQ